MNYYAYYNYYPYQGYYPYLYPGQTSWTPAPTPSVPTSTGAPYTGSQFTSFYPTPTVPYGYDMSHAMYAPAATSYVPYGMPFTQAEYCAPQQYSEACNTNESEGDQPRTPTEWYENTDSVEEGENYWAMSAPPTMYPYAGAAYYASYPSYFYQPYCASSFVDPRIAMSQTGFQPCGQSNELPLEPEFAKTRDMTTSIQDNNNNNTTDGNNNHQDVTNAKTVEKRQLRLVNAKRHALPNYKPYSTRSSKVPAALGTNDLGRKTTSLSSSRSNSLESQTESSRVVTRVNSTALNNNNTIETETRICTTTDATENASRKKPMSQTHQRASTDLKSKARVKEPVAEIKVLHVAKRPVFRIKTKHEC